MAIINPREPISLKVTYTDTDGVPVEKLYRSLHKASTDLSLSIASLKELSRGGTPKLPPDTPQNLKVCQIPTLPKPEETNIINGKYYCDICDKYIQPRSKYDHINTKSHLKIKAILEKK